MKLKMAVKFKTMTCFLCYEAVYNGCNAPAKHIYTERSGRTQPQGTCKCRRVLLSPHTLRKIREPDSSQETG